jgi:hypothetical protein
MWRYVATGIGLAVLLVLWYVQDRSATDPASPTASASAAAGTALAALDTLTVSDAGTTDGYDRDLFGQPWADVDGNGCDTRNDILTRDLTDVTYQGTSTCVVTSGVLDDPYTGEEIRFERGRATSAAVQIDHVVALANGWRSGASGWDAATRRAFANDPLNLLAADGPANQAKGAKDASAWLPENTSFGCPYVARQIAVKSTYALAVTAAEHDAMRSVLATCPQEPLPR